MDIYTCPMHPEVESNKPGRCPKCGMQLVKKSKAVTKEEPQKTYTPLITIVGVLFLTALAISVRNYSSLSSFIEYFMIGFFVTFSAFKLMDLKGFAEGYSMYDLLAKRWYSYGFIYPFIELFFGIAMILGSFSTTVLWLEVLVMSFSGVGVLVKILKKEKFQCACLGTFLKVPLTYITLVEDFGMAILALTLLFLR